MVVANAVDKDKQLQTSLERWERVNDGLRYGKSLKKLSGAGQSLGGVLHSAGEQGCIP